MLSYPRRIQRTVAKVAPPTSQKRPIGTKIIVHIQSMRLVAAVRMGALIGGFVIEWPIGHQLQLLALIHADAVLLQMALESVGTFVRAEMAA